VKYIFADTLLWRSNSRTIDGYAASVIPRDCACDSPAIRGLKGVSMPQRTPIRHGEILFLSVNSVPHAHIEQVTSCIVGHSESGHHPSTAGVCAPVKTRLSGRERARRNTSQ